MTESEDTEWMDAPMGPPAKGELCLAVYGEIAKDSCLRPRGHDGEHRDNSGFRWPYTSKEILRRSEGEG